MTSIQGWHDKLPHRPGGDDGSSFQAQADTLDPEAVLVMEEVSLEEASPERGQGPLGWLRCLSVEKPDRIRQGFVWTSMKNTLHSYTIQN